MRTKGLFSFYEDGHGECCRVRKVRPLRRQLTGLQAWITGQRKDQSPGTRQSVPVVQVDPVFEGQAGGPGSLIKYNPLSNVTSQEVWNFLRVMVSMSMEMLILSCCFRAGERRGKGWLVGGICPGMWPPGALGPPVGVDAEGW